MSHSVETLNKIDRSKPAREARRKEYNGLASLPFLSQEQAERLEALSIEVVEDNHVAFEERTK